MNINDIQIVCEHPRIIINPRAKELIAEHGNYVVKGKMYSCRYQYRSLVKLPDKVLPVTRTKVISDWSSGKPVFKRVDIPIITHDDLNSCYIIDRSTRERFPLYLEVPCGHCDCCKMSKINSLVERCRMECQCYDSYPWFVTLTYDDEHCPSSGVLVDDVQKFFKRLRINLERSGFDYKLRYIVCGEYGKNTHRPHYHAIIFGIKSFSPQEYERVGDIIYKSWNLGYTMHRLVNPEDDKTFYYTSKYLRKDCVIPEYDRGDGTMVPCNRPFLISHEQMAE